MINKDLRKKIDAYAKDYEVEITILDNLSFDNSIVGITEDGKLIYSLSKMITECQEELKCNYLEAVEWIEANTLPAISYFGDKAPIIIYLGIDELKEKY